MLVTHNTEQRFLYRACIVWINWFIIFQSV